MAADADSITAWDLDARYGPPDLRAIDKLQVAVAEFSRKYQRRLFDSRL